MNGPTISPVIQLGQILNSLSIVATIIGAVWYVSSEVSKNEKDIDFAKQAISELKSTQDHTLQTLNTLSAAVARIEGRLETKFPQ